MSNYHSNWADLPIEILQLIGNRLETRIDVFRFRAICRSWRSVIPFSHNNSTLSPTHIINLPPPFTATAFLSPATFYRLEDDTQTAACLIKVTQSTSGKIKLINPLSSGNTNYKRLRTVGSAGKSINMLNLRVVQVIKGYRLKFKKKLPIVPNRVFVKKVVLFGNNNSGILVIFDVGKLGYLGFKDENWIVFGSEATKYDDVVVYKGQFYVVDSIGTVYWIDANTMSLVQFSPPLYGPGQVKNLVVSDGELFVVDSYVDDERQMALPRPVDNFERVDIRVYRLDQDWGTWVDVNSLGDRVFVLGKEVCFSVSMKDFPGCDRNCVYFIDSKLEDRHMVGDFRRCFGRVFDIEDRRRMKTVDCFPSHRKLFSLPMNFPCTMPSSE